MTIDDFTVGVATEEHLEYVDEILRTIEDATKVRWTGIAKRSHGTMRNSWPTQG